MRLHCELPQIMLSAQFGAVHANTDVLIFYLLRNKFWSAKIINEHYLQLRRKAPRRSDL